MSYLIAQILSFFSWSFYSYSKPCICIHICISITKSRLQIQKHFTWAGSQKLDRQSFIFTFYSAFSQSNKQESQPLESVWRWRPGLFWMKSKSAETRRLQQYLSPTDWSRGSWERTFPRHLTPSGTEFKPAESLPLRKRRWGGEKSCAVRLHHQRGTNTPQDFLCSLCQRKNTIIHPLSSL